MSARPFLGTMKKLHGNSTYLCLIATLHMANCCMIELLHVCNFTFLFMSLFIM